MLYWQSKCQIDKKKNEKSIPKWSTNSSSRLILRDPHTKKPKMIQEYEDDYFLEEDKM